MRRLYSAAWWVALPLVLGRLWWRGRKEPGYREHVAERLGFYDPPASGPQQNQTIWVHAVSVGETRAAEPLIHALLERYPACTILLTHMTPTGRATGKALFEKFAPRVQQTYLPYDTGWMVHRFIVQFSPSVCVLMETEVWPNLMAQCVRHNVPVALVNARLSERSLRKARRMSALMVEAAQGIACAAAQTEADADRLRQLGTRNVQVTGSIKFDVMPPQDMIAKGQQWRMQFGNRPVLLCASTREGEEALILDALQSVPDAIESDALIVIVPRHPQRFEEVAQMIAMHGFRMQRRTAMQDAPLPAEVRILLGDSMAEMFAYYAACDAAFIGGSLLPLGGQNLIEACALGKPVLIGPHTFNFSAISEEAVAAGAALRVPDAVALLRQAVLLLHEDARRLSMGVKAKSFAVQRQGATMRTLEMLEPLLR